MFSMSRSLCLIANCISFVYTPHGFDVFVEKELIGSSDEINLLPITVLVV